MLRAARSPDRASRAAHQISPSRGWGRRPMGDPLYLAGGGARAEALQGDGGYRLRAQRLAIQRPDGSLWRLDAEGERPMPG